MTDYEKNLQRWLENTGATVGDAVLILDADAVEKYRTQHIDWIATNPRDVFQDGQTWYISRITQMGNSRQLLVARDLTQTSRRIVPFYALAIVKDDKTQTKKERN